MKSCTMPKLQTKAYQKDKGLGNLLKKAGTNIKIILINLFIRTALSTFFALALLGAAKGLKEVNWSGMLAVDGILLLYALSPLRHFVDKVYFHQYGVVYKSLFRKREYLFATWKPHHQSREFIIIYGMRYFLEGEKFLFSTLNYTYIEDFLENFQSLYMKYINIGRDSENHTFPIAASEKDAIKHMVQPIPSDDESLDIVYAYEYRSTRYSSIYSYYAIGIGEDNLYVVPFIVGTSGIGYEDGYYYEKKNLGYIKRNGEDDKWQFYELQNKEKRTLFQFHVEADNKKLWGNPFAIRQGKEAEAFYYSIEQWMLEINEK